jgi:hypothetical protein
MESLLGRQSAPASAVGLRAPPGLGDRQKSFAQAGSPANTLVRILERVTERVRGFL